MCVCVRLLKHQANFECAELPALREKLVDRSLFDVAQLLFIVDVHMSLMMLLGSQSCRSDDALERRAAARMRRSRSRGHRGSPVAAGPSAVSDGSAVADAPAVAAASSASSVFAWLITAGTRPRIVVFAPILWFGVVVAAKATGVDNLIDAMFR